MMVNLSGGPGWWQASDGKWYPPETHPDYQAPVAFSEQPGTSGAPPTALPQRRQAPDGSWQTLGDDGYWYPDDEDADSEDQFQEQPPDATRRRFIGGRRFWIELAVVVVIVLGIVVTVAILKHAGTGGTPPGLTLSQFEGQILQQVQTTGVHGFGVRRASSATCIMPSTWASGDTFHCFIYNHSGTGLGTINGTVLPDQGGQAIWNSQWNPS